VVGFVVFGDKEDGAELAELVCQKGEEAVFVFFGVADVAQQGEVGRFWRDLEVVGAVAFGGFEMQV